MTKSNAEKPKTPPEPDPKDEATVKEAAPEEGRQVNESDDAETEEALGEVEDRMAEETEKGFRGTPVDDTPDEYYTVEGVGSDPTRVPEAQQYKSEAILEATNPEVRARH